MSKIGKGLVSEHKKITIGRIYIGKERPPFNKDDWFYFFMTLYFILMFGIYGYFKYRMVLG